VDVIKRDLKNMDLTWEEAGELAIDKAESSTCGPMQPSGCGMN